MQLIIAYHLDINEYVSIASLDLSAAFDIVNTATIIKRIETIGIPNNIIRLLKTWLKNRSYYMSVNGVNLLVVNLTCGTIQGYILEPLFYAIYVSPLFDLTPLTNFADDNFAIKWSKAIPELTENLQPDLEMITKCPNIQG